MDTATVTAVVQFLRSLPHLVRNIPATPDCSRVTDDDAGDAYALDAGAGDASAQDAASVDAAVDDTGIGTDVLYVDSDKVDSRSDANSD
jgi:hypothetical protein